eukprot:3312902-Amphidinium_carterae.1
MASSYASFKPLMQMGSASNGMRTTASHNSIKHNWVTNWHALALVGTVRILSRMKIPAQKCSLIHVGRIQNVENIRILGQLLHPGVRVLPLACKTCASCQVKLFQTIPLSSLVQKPAQLEGDCQAHVASDHKLATSDEYAQQGYT